MTGYISNKAFKMTHGWIQDSFSSWDGTRIFYRFYPLPGARHTAIMVHGYGEHSGRYEKFPEKMKDLSAQFAVLDLRGMGRSEGAQGTINTFDDYLRDLSAFIEHLRSKHSLPRQFILFGHSMGGLVALFWAMKNPQNIRMLILSAPFFGLKTAWFLGPFNRLAMFFAPRFVYKNPVRSRTLSHDSGEVTAHRKDPLILRFISARLVGEIFNRMELLRKQPILSVPFPVHMLVAGEEHVVDPAATHRFFDRVVAPYKERTTFEGFFHEIFNEKGQQRAFKVLRTTIEDCV
jgi:alpha-beta hydrolase superfamily lysophospholipase